MEFLNQSSIILDGQRVSVTPNLESALRHLRNPDAPLLLWVDAVCINQDDPLEKQHQVGLMSEIYRHAKQTVVWLGPEADSSDRAMDFIATSHWIDVMDPEFRLSDFAPPWPDLHALFARSWWSRIWVIQEVLLSKDVVVRCGHKQIPFANFVELARKDIALSQRMIKDSRFGVTHISDSWDILVPPTTPFHKVFAVWHFIEGRWAFPLWDTLVLFNAFSASLPRDRVYGLLGICDPRDRAAIEIDYTEHKTDSMIMKDTVACIIKFANHLQPLQFVLSSGRQEKELDLPSWVPDLLRTTYVSNSSPLVHMECNASHRPTGWFRLNHPVLGPMILDHPRLNSVILFFSSAILSRVRTMLQDSNGAAASFSDNDSVLILRGVTFDTILHRPRLTFYSLMLYMTTSTARGLSRYLICRPLSSTGRKWFPRSQRTRTLQGLKDDTIRSGALLSSTLSAVTKAGVNCTLPSRM